MCRNERAISKFKQLTDAAVALSSSLDLARIGGEASREACRLFDYERGVVLVCEENGEVLSLNGAWCSVTDEPPLSAGGSSYLAYPDDLRRIVEPMYTAGSTLPKEIRCCLANWLHDETDALIIPLIAEGSTQGIIILSGRRGSPPADQLELDLASAFGLHVAATIKNARMAQKANLQLFETVARGKREWEQTFDAISDGIIISDTNYHVVRANKAFAAKLEKHPRDLVGKACYMLIGQSSQPCADCPLQMELAMQQSQPSIERTIRGVTFQVMSYPIFDEYGHITGIVDVVKDITEQKKMQELMIRSEKLRAVGEMASGIAHDFNNLLASILGWSEIMLLHDMPAHLREPAMAIHQAALDGTETVKRIQEYTRIRKDATFNSLDINEVVRGAIELARPRWKGLAERKGIAINITTELADTPPVQGNAPDLREVFLNIIFNAIDAMPNGGEIKIRTGLKDNKVFVEISDSGIGMSEDVQKRVFDPFFTTKGPAGNGLGLSIAYGIVSRHNGELVVSSSPGCGATFTTFLPVATVVAEMQEQRPTGPSQKARVLLIDDDERALKAIEAMLRAEGHFVTACSSGAEGLSVLTDREFDLVITDLGMPEMNGWDVVAEVKRLSPTTPTILLTGWGAEIASERLAELGVDGVVQKPCRLPALRQTIAQVLVRDATELAIASEAEGERLERALRIVVIEDNRWFASALKERLELDGYRVYVATSGTEGLNIIGREEVDLVLADLKLPDISGLELAGIIKQVRRKAFVALMTGDAAAFDSTFLQATAADAVLHKPWKESELQAVLHKAMATGEKDH